jgi:endoglucanase
MAVPALLEELLLAPGAVGHEDAVAAIVRREAAAFGAEVESDVLGSTVARVAGTTGGRLLALFAHADQVGMVVRRVDEDGFLLIGRLGNWAAASALGQRVRVVTAGGEVAGVVTRVGEGDVTWEDLRVDVGAVDRGAAVALVSAGDAAVPDGAPLALDSGRVVSAALDNRIGLYAALEALRRLTAEPPSWDVALVASTQEETAISGGAAAVAGRLRPDVALVLETTYASDAPKPDPEPWGETRLGGGPVVFRGAVVHPDVVAGLLGAAREGGIEVAIEAGGETSTDADDIYTAGGGIAAATVAVPLRYMHTASEMAQLADVDAACALVEAYARSLTPDVSFIR